MGRIHLVFHASLLDRIARARGLWVGYEPEECTWKPAENVEHAKDAVADFHRVLPQRPSPEGPFSTTRGASSGLHAPPCASTRLQSTPRADSRFLFTNFGVEGTTCHEFVGLAGARETAKSTAAELLLHLARSLLIHLLIDSLWSTNIEALRGQLYLLNPNGKFQAYEYG